MYDARSHPAGIIERNVNAHINLDGLGRLDHTITSQGYSDLTSTAEDVCFENINPVEAMLGEGGLVEKYGAELTRDWFDVFLVRRVGVNSDVQIPGRGIA